MITVNPLGGKNLQSYVIVNPIAYLLFCYYVYYYSHILCELCNGSKWMGKDGGIYLNTTELNVPDQNMDKRVSLNMHALFKKKKTFRRIF